MSRTTQSRRSRTLLGPLPWARSNGVRMLSTPAPGGVPPRDSDVVEDAEDHPRAWDAENRLPTEQNAVRRDGHHRIDADHGAAADSAAPASRVRSRVSHVLMFAVRRRSQLVPDSGLGWGSEGSRRGRRAWWHTKPPCRSSVRTLSTPHRAASAFG